ncbi:ATP-binding protein [Lysobacter sp. BMK333-48F3]|uniref:ATP-binding protein n=1 Tax=Lysobacter sp. BMK333-48F3 TaxID=2867962 RepID=UPI001C8B5402|nr:ATP-binding protein [Lysobacter sp. BMK333-48F3]MBX9401802.1 ATP-binding protein [Lysobacter sp. BMK333-48F3]
MNSENQRYTANLSQQIWDFSSLLLKSRFADALERGVSRYPIRRSLRLAARAGVDAVFDDLALNLGYRAHRIDGPSLILDGEGLFVDVGVSRKADYCSFYFAIWADSVERAAQAIQGLQQRIEAVRIREPMFSIDWHFLTGRGELQSASIEELADDVLIDEAYPEIGDVAGFVDRYLRAKETVLVLQGPPGTGKTRLIRAILGEISRRNDGNAQALYTGDKKALECDEIYVKFITGDDHAFVVEDADHLLRPRAEGNEHLHRFLAIADGVVRAQGRKIIFSTNLPNVGDLDDALVRPGRCFAHAQVRELRPVEAAALIQRLAGERGIDPEPVRQALAGSGRKSYSLAAIYQAVGHAG